MRKYVASRTLKRVDWHNSTLIAGDLAEAVGGLRRAPGGELQVTGSGQLIQTLLAHDLVDEFRLWVFPVVLGKGKRLFAEGTVPGGLTLKETRTFGSGVVVQVYQVAGRLSYGSFQLEQPSEAEIERRRRVAGGVAGPG